jgi:hypothetical protein
LNAGFLRFLGFLARATADSAAIFRVAAANQIAVNAGSTAYGTRGVVLRACGRDPRLLLDVIDSILAMGCDSELVEELRGHLDAGKSVWGVAVDESGLERWVPEIESAAYEAAVVPGDAASDELVEAWNNLNGLHPDPSDAWDHAIKACEHILKPIVTPNQRDATLGNVLGQLRAEPPVVDFILRDNALRNQVDPLETFEHMLHLIWPNPDRHGSVAMRTPTLVEAQAVVQTAILVVHWARIGVLVRR